MRGWLKAASGEIHTRYTQKFLTERVVKHWNKLPREADMAPSLLVFEKCFGQCS